MFEENGNEYKHKINENCISKDKCRLCDFYDTKNNDCEQNDYLIPWCVYNGKRNDLQFVYFMMSENKG